MSERRLNIRSSEAHRIASGLSAGSGRTTTEIVVEALRELEARRAPLDELGLTAAQREDYDDLRALAREARPHIASGSPPGHDWLYDEHGLPK